MPPTSRCRFRRRRRSTYACAGARWQLVPAWRRRRRHRRPQTPVQLQPWIVRFRGFEYNTRSLDDSAFIDGGVGYRFNQYFRADMTGEYRAAAYSAVRNLHRGLLLHAQDGQTGYDDAYTGNDAQSSTVSSTATSMLGTWYGITPFAGAGVGIANISVIDLTDDGCVSVRGVRPIPATRRARPTSPTRLMAGLDFQVTRNLVFEIGYRYLNMPAASSSGAINCQNVSAVPVRSRSPAPASLSLRTTSGWVCATSCPTSRRSGRLRC